MRVAIDATPILAAEGRTGIGVVTGEVVDRLAMRTDLELVAYASTGRHPTALAKAPLPDAIDRASSWRWMPARPLRAIWRGNRGWPVAEHWTGSVDVVHGTNTVVPPTSKAGTVVTVHDLAPLRASETVLPPHRRDIELVKQAIRRGSFVHTLSEFVRQEVIGECGADPDRVVAIPPGPPSLLPADQGDGHRLAHSNNYLLALGSIHPRKNLVRLIEAFTILATEEPDLHLVLAGAVSPNGTDVVVAAANSVFSKRIKCDGKWIDERAKAALVRGARVVVYPSLYEGFGLPLLEAMQAGVPVVTTTAGAIPEVAGDAALLVSATSTNELVDGIRSVLHDETLRSRLIDAGRMNLRRFSWNDFESRLVALYAESAKA